MKKRYVLKNRTRFSLFIAAIVMMVFTTFFANSVYGYKEPIYKEITIKQGDTLWGIAQKYNANNDIRKYIYDIKKLNNLTSSNIYRGSKIKIPLD